MQIITDSKEIQRTMEIHRLNGKRIGFVPTMGYLHEGHLSLVRAVQTDCDLSVCSIYVNPTQFGPAEDLGRYPRDLERDIHMLEECGTDILFAPQNLYLPDSSTVVREDQLSRGYCGTSRPWHFQGVTTIVCKLFNLTKPHVACFGQKDYQQAMVVQRMVRDLDMDISIRVCPIVREADGLAMSSRNKYLSTEERLAALVLSQALRKANELFEKGKFQSRDLLSAMEGTIRTSSLARIDYVAIADAVNLEPVELIQNRAVALLAVYIGTTRLIDNHILGEPFFQHEKEGNLS